VVYELVEVLAFTPRKRMSVLVKDTARPNEVLLFSKGADSAIFEKAHPYDYARFNDNLNSFAKDGLRTLVFAKRILTSQLYERWQEQRATARSHYRQKMITKEELAMREEELVEEMESHLTVLGATGIEDRLQDGVPETIARLQQAGIKVMMITGDKLETAENIGYLAQLIREDYLVFKLSADVLDLRERA
jgi:phospholipid-translocating ATPase